MSLTAMTAMVSTPFALMASAFWVIEGTCILWQVPVKAPGTANSATFLPLKTSSVLFHAGPSDVITRNFASGSRSPTLMGMILVLSLAMEPRRQASPAPCGCGTRPARHQISAPGELVEPDHDLDRRAARTPSQRDGRALVLGAGRCAVEIEGEALCTGWRPLDRRRHRQRPVRRWPFGEQGDAFSSRRGHVDDDARPRRPLRAPNRLDRER